jgi:hypothetical protein
VQVFRTNEFEFTIDGSESWTESKISKKSNWNCDGEIMNAYKVKAK